MQWSTYAGDSKRTSYSIVPTSNHTTEIHSVDGFSTMQTDHSGITATMMRHYGRGITTTRTDGRSNTTTAVTDLAGRTISVTDAAGHPITTEYCADSDRVAKVTDAMGNTTCYAYDVRGRKVAEWGSAIQPACFSYDEANRMITLTTFRATGEVIDTDPRERKDGDTTTWQYHDTTGLELQKTYADGSSETKRYGAFNNCTSITDARGVVKTNAYDRPRGLLLRTTYSDNTTARAYTYNHLGQLTQVTDDAGTRTLVYNAYGELESDILVAGEVTYTITEQRDEFGRSTGYTYAKNDAMQQTVTTGYAADGRISTAGFMHGGTLKSFEYAYLPGSNLLEKLAMPNNMTLTQSYEAQRDLLTDMTYKRGDTLVTQRHYAYDELGRPTQRETQYPGKSITHSDTFEHNSRSELVNAQLDDAAYTYAYDNIGNRRMAVEGNESSIYEANALNQYTSIVDGADAFEPLFDFAGNQTLVKTSTGIWHVTYNAENRPVSFTSEDGNTVVECVYDFMGRRTTKKVTSNGRVTLHQRYIYRGYLQIAAHDLTRSAIPAMWYILWDPTQPTATRPLAIQKDGAWYTYGWDLTKNICEIYGQSGYIRTLYTYTPYGAVTSEGDVSQLIQWSSEFNDVELGLVYYNYRHYDAKIGSWMSHDPANEFIERNLYAFVSRRPYFLFDQLGLWYATPESRGQERRVYLKISRNDTDETLAKEIGLDLKTIDIWGKRVCGYKKKNKIYCGYSVPNVWVSANLINGPERIGGSIGTTASSMVQWSHKLIIVNTLEDFKDNLTEDLWGFILYAHGLHLKYPNSIYHNGDIDAITKDGYTEIYKQTELISDVLQSTGGRRIAEAHLMQCYSFKDKSIVAAWKTAAVISKGFTRMNVCGINMIFT